LVVTILDDAVTPTSRSTSRTTVPRGRSSALKIDVVTVLVLEMFAAFFGFGMYLAYQL
jgi:hypothetical protein